MVTMKRVQDWCSESWGDDYAEKMRWRLDSIIFAYCEEYIFFHLWLRKNDPLLPNVVDLISSYIGDLRLLCAYFKLVYDTLDPDNLERKNITFRRWMVARCVLARLEVGTESMTTLIRDEVNKAMTTVTTERDRLGQDLDTVTEQREQIRGELAAVTTERDGLREKNAALEEELRMMRLQVGKRIEALQGQGGKGKKKRRKKTKRRRKKKKKTRRRR